MKQEYDFSKAERGRFCKPDAELRLPVYLDPDNLSFVESIAERKNTDLSTVVNDLLRSDSQVAKAIE